MARTVGSVLIFLAVAACETLSRDDIDDGREANRLAPVTVSEAMISACLPVARGEAATDARTLGFAAEPVPIDLGPRRASAYFVDRDARTELFFGPRGDCNITSFATNGSELRAAVTRAVGDGSLRFETLYSGPNNTGVATRDIYCADLVAGGAGTVIVTTVETGRVPGMPTLQVTSITDETSCAELAEGTDYAIPRP